jgi:hypothetical protein
MSVSQELENLDTAPWDAPFWEAQDAFNRSTARIDPSVQFPNLTADPLPIRPRLHVLCALYAHSRQLDQRLSLLEGMEALTLQLAQALAVDLLEKGWRPPDQQAAA